MWHSDFKVTVTISLVIIYCSLSHSCGHEEYEIDGKCCTMCKPGTHVYKHCTEHNTTSCIQCTGKTFINEPNGLPKCRPCSVCDSGLGLNTNTECTFSSDTLCGILDQHFCTEQSKKGCRLAQRHTICRPGQFVEYNGTELTDTVCQVCPNGTFSDGLSTTCKPHTDCQSLGLPELKAGSPSSDSECGEKASNPLSLTLGIVAGIIFSLIFTVILVIILISLKKGRRKHSTNTKQGEAHNVMLQPDVEDSRL